MRDLQRRSGFDLQRIDVLLYAGALATSSVVMGDDAESWNALIDPTPLFRFPGTCLQAELGLPNASVIGIAQLAWRVLFSVAFLIALYGFAIALAGARFLEIWGVAFLCFLMIGDPILLSQHVHLPLRKTNGAKVKPFALAVQDLFKRTIVLPPWIERWVVLHFTTHGVHHAHPQVAHYDLAQIQFTSSHAIRWSEWLRAAKRIPATQLLYQSSEDTGVFI